MTHACNSFPDMTFVVSLPVLSCPIVQISCADNVDLGPGLRFMCLCSGQIGFMVCAKQTGKDFKMNIPRRTPPSQGPSGYPPLRYQTKWGLEIWGMPSKLLMPELFSNNLITSAVGPAQLGATLDGKCPHVVLKSAQVWSA